MSDTSEDWRGLLTHAFFYLKFRPRTAKEMRTYLLKKIQKRHWSTDDVQKTIVFLTDEKYLDDAAFVKWFVEQRNTGKPKGRRALEYELQKLGVEIDTIRTFLSEQTSDDVALAGQALRSRWSRLLELDKRKRFEKAAQFLSRRGFDFDTVKKAINAFEDSK